MEIGRHDARQPRGRLRTAYDAKVLRGEAPWVFDGNPTEEEKAAQAAVDAMAAGVPPRGWVIIEDGGMVPVKLDRASGWLADEDRDSTLAAKLRELVTALDGYALEGKRHGGSPDRELLASILGDMVSTWAAIRAITQGRDITQVADNTRGELA